MPPSLNMIVAPLILLICAWAQRSANCQSVSSSYSPAHSHFRPIARPDPSAPPPSLQAGRQRDARTPSNLYAHASRQAAPSQLGQSNRSNFIAALNERVHLAKLAQRKQHQHAQQQQQHNRPHRQAREPVSDRRASAASWSPNHLPSARQEKSFVPTRQRPSGAGEQTARPTVEPADSKLLICYYTTRQSAPYWPTNAREFVIPAERVSQMGADGQWRSASSSINVGNFNDRYPNYQTGAESQTHAHYSPAFVVGAAERPTAQLLHNNRLVASINGRAQQMILVSPESVPFNASGEPSQQMFFVPPVTSGRHSITSRQDSAIGTSVATAAAAAAVAHKPELIGDNSNRATENNGFYVGGHHQPGDEAGGKRKHLNDGRQANGLHLHDHQSNPSTTTPTATTGTLVMLAHKINNSGGNNGHHHRHQVIPFAAGGANNGPVEQTAPIVLANQPAPQSLTRQRQSSLSPSPSRSFVSAASGGAGPLQPSTMPMVSVVASGGEHLISGTNDEQASGNNYFYYLNNNQATGPASPAASTPPNEAATLANSSQQRARSPQDADSEVAAALGSSLAPSLNNAESPLPSGVDSMGGGGQSVQRKQTQSTSSSSSIIFPTNIHDDTAKTPTTLNTASMLPPTPRPAHIVLADELLARQHQQQHQTSTNALSSPLSTMFDVFGVASQYLMRFKPSSLISAGSFLADQQQAAGGLAGLLPAHSAQHQLGNSTANNSLFGSFPFASSLLSAATGGSAQSSSQLKSLAAVNNSSGGFLSRLTLQNNQQQRREEICGRTIQTPERRIIGGEGARYGEFPYQVHIKIAKHQCGGALVDRQSIVTAAHCVYHFITRAPVSKLQIVIGAYDIEDEQYQELPPQYFKVNKVKLHPNFRFSASHPDRYDIAILKLDKPVRYTDNVLPVCLPSKELKYENLVGTVTGFGKTDPSLSNRYGTRLLQKVDVPIIENQECERWHRTRGIDLKIFPEMMCAGYEDGLKDACVGDSGGPLVVKSPVGSNGSFRWTLAGITSAGFGCAQSRQPGIYHRVSHTVDWILENLD